MLGLCRWQMYHPKRHLHTCVHCNAIYHVPRLHAYTEPIFRDGWVNTWHTHTHTHTHRHVYTLIHWHRTAQSKSRQNVFSSNMNRDANDRRSNSDKICLSKLHWYSLEGTV